MLHIWQSYFYLHRNLLRLGEDQIDHIESILNDQGKFLAQKDAERRILLMDVRQWLLKDPIERRKAEEKLRSLETLNTAIVSSEIDTLERMMAVLTPEQRQKMHDILIESRFTGPFGP